MSEHPLIAEHRALFGVSHTCLGRNLHHQRKTADNDPILQSGEVGPISHTEQEKRLGNSQMWVPHRSFEPAKIAVAGASGYASKIHLPDPHEHDYSKVRTSTANLREIGRAYDAMPTRDASAVPHFERLRKEIGDQHDHLTHAMGIRTEVVHDDPYPSVHHMVQDVLNNKRIKVLSTKTTGGHDFLDDDTNDKFRAVHDVFGHAATGRGFDAHGEEGAWLAHSRMFTSHARGAMSSETRGQNAALHINGSFQAQKTALLPSHLWDDTAVNKHTSALLPFEAFLTEAAAWLNSKGSPAEGEHRITSKVVGSIIMTKCSDCGHLAKGFDMDHEDIDARHDEARGKTATRKVAIGWEAPGDPPWLNPPGAHKVTYHMGKWKKDSSSPGRISASCSDCGTFLHGGLEIQHSEVDRAHEEAKAKGLNKEHPDYQKPSFHASLRTVAHDSGDGETIYHCPFCGAGQVIARSDRTIECQFCHTCFTVQVQPQYPAFPQTINGVPVEVPGMPGQMGVDPAGAGGPVDPNGDMAAGGFPPGEEDPEAEEEEAPAEDDEEDGGNPFAKGSALRTQAGKTLSVEDYMAHLALRHTSDREATLVAVRARRG